MFGSAFKQAIPHSFATLLATVSVWALWMGWFVFIAGNQAIQWGGQWGTYRFGMTIAFIVSLILSGGFLVMSFVYHFFVESIPREREILSSLTLALTSLVLLLVLPEGGLPLIALLIGLPIVATFWMFNSAGRKNEP